MFVCDSDISMNDDDNMIQQKNIKERTQVSWYIKVIVDISTWKEDFLLILKFKILIKTDDDDDGFMGVCVCVKHECNVNQKWSGKHGKGGKNIEG